MLVPPPRVASDIASRLERAYRRLYPQLGLECSRFGMVWEAAAAALIGLNQRDAMYPVDPELFVACQVDQGHADDPWTFLANPKAIARYKKSIRHIVTRLRRELRSELRRIETNLEMGQTLEYALQQAGSRLSPLGRFIAAVRAGRTDLARSYRSACEEQHRACPLYRAAVSGLIAPHLYPVDEVAPEIPLPPHLETALLNALFSQN